MAGDLGDVFSGVGVGGTEDAYQDFVDYPGMRDSGCGMLDAGCWILGDCTEMDGVGWHFGDLYCSICGAEDGFADFESVGSGDPDHGDGTHARRGGECTDGVVSGEVIHGGF